MADENMTEETVVSETTKRTRLSPRVKFADEVLNMIDGHIADLNAEVEAGANQKRTAVIASTVSALSDLKGRVQAAVEAGPVQAGSSAGKRHYVGITAGGERVAFDTASTPKAGGEYASVLGPFQTIRGRDLRVIDATVPSPVVF